MKGIRAIHKLSTLILSPLLQLAFGIIGALCFIYKGPLCLIAYAVGWLFLVLTMGKIFDWSDIHIRKRTRS